MTALDKRSRSVAGLMLLIVSLSLTGCGLIETVLGIKKSESAGGTRPTALKVKYVSLVMAKEANDNWPATVDLVRVKDTDLVKELLAISSEEWFKEKQETFQSANPEAYFDRWEIVPGTSVERNKPQRIKGRVAGVLFCDLRDPKPPMRLSQNGHILINIGDEGCEVSRAGR